MFGSKRVTTLNIEANSLRGLILNGKNVEWWDRIPLEPGTVRDGIILEQKALGQAIDSLLSKVETHRDRIIISLTGLHSTFRILSIPQMKLAQMDDAVRRAAKKEMPLPVDELYLSWQPLGTKGNKQEVFALGVPREAVDGTIKALTAGGVKPYIMDLKALALARIANRREALLLDLEPENFGITLIAQGIPSIMRTFIPKRGDMILEDNIRRLAGEISRTVEFYNRDHTDNPLTTEVPVFLTGEMASNPETAEIVQAEIDYPIATLQIPISHDATFPIASYAVNIGLAMRGNS